MSLKTYSRIRLIFVFVLAVLISVSISLGNFFMPLVAMAIAMLILTGMRRRITGVVADERDYKLAGDAARSLYATSADGIQSTTTSAPPPAITCDGLMSGPPGLIVTSRPASL